MANLHGEGPLVLWKNLPLFYSLAYKPVLFECLQDVTRPWVETGADANTMWRVATKVLKKPLWTADKGTILYQGIELITSRKEMASCKILERD